MTTRPDRLNFFLATKLTEEPFYLGLKAHNMLTEKQRRKKDFFGNFPLLSHHVGQSQKLNFVAERDEGDGLYTSQYFYTNVEISYNWKIGKWKTGEQLSDWRVG